MNDDHKCAVCGKLYAIEADYFVETRRWRVCTSGHLWFNCRCGSTLMVRKGKYPWYSPDMQMSDEARSVFNRLGNLKDLPHLPSIVMEIQQMLADPEVEPRKLAATLRRDPLLSGQVLKSADRLRSTRNRDNPPLTSLEHSIVYIGVRALADLILSSAMRVFPIPASEFSIKDFWTHAYLTGAIAERLAHRYNTHHDADQVYVAASLCNIGKLVIACCFPPLATKITRRISSPQTLTTWRKAECFFEFPDHVILGEIAASLWGLPEYVMQVTRHHHDLIASEKEQPLKLHEIAAIANQLAHRASFRPHLVEVEIFESFKKKRGVSDQEIEFLVTDAAEIRKRISSDYS